MNIPGAREVPLLDDGPAVDVAWDLMSDADLHVRGPLAGALVLLAASAACALFGTTPCSRDAECGEDRCGDDGFCASGGPARADDAGFAVDAGPDGDPTLLLEWTMDDVASGAVRDTSGNGHDGTVTGLEGPFTLRLGADLDGVFPYRGRVDELRIWTRALTAAEIDAMPHPLLP